MNEPGRLLRRVRRPGRLLLRRRRLRAGIVQLAYVAAGVALGAVVPQIDVRSTTDVDATRALLLSVGAGIIPFIGVVYSLLFLVVQFGMTTFTARLNLFRDSPIVGHSFGFFMGMMVFCFTAAFTMGTDDDVTVLLPVSVAVLLLVTLAVFRALQSAAFRSIQLAATLEQVARQGRQVIEGIYPDAYGTVEPAEWSPRDGTVAREVRWPQRAGVLQAIDVPRLVKGATSSATVIEMLAGAGEIVPEKGVVALVHGDGGTLADSTIVKALTVGPERTFEQDPALALRALTDIALRALSPAVNDPTTASQALDISDSLLRLLAERDLDVSRVSGDDDGVRLVLELPQWEDYVALAVDEVIHYGEGSPQVVRRLEKLLADVAASAPPERRAALEVRAERLATAAAVP